MRSFIAIAPFVLASASLAQSDPATARVLVTPGQTVNCPVGIESRRIPGGAVRNVDRDQTPSGLGYSIGLRSLDMGVIDKAEVRLIGIDRAQLIAAGAPISGRYFAEKFVLSNTGAVTSFDSVIYSRHLTGVEWVEVDKVLYNDGRVWQQTAGSTCRVQPGGLLPVG